MDNFTKMFKSLLNIFYFTLDILIFESTNLIVVYLYCISKEKSQVSLNAHV